MSFPETMRAAFVRETGGAIEIGDLPVPRPGPTDVLVRTTASAVDRVDLFVRAGTYRTRTPFPFVLGRDLVGTVAAVGPVVDAVTVGDRVWANSLGHDGRQGAFAEYAVVAADRVYPVPDGVADTDVVAIAHTGATAWLGLVREAAVRPAETVVVGGAGGGVGSAAVQLATVAGARVIATCSPSDDAWCRSCGADVVLDYHHDDLHDRIRDAAPGGVDVWWDNSGHQDFVASLPLMRRGGRVVVSAGLGSGTHPALPVGDMYTRDVSLRGFAISNASVADLADAATGVSRILAAGRISARIGATYRLADAAAAHRALESGTVTGRIVVLP
ncbi:NADPH:quinone reductase [Prescottella subtropica]|uniref:NADPH:quinone reductase n=1 Tax=Prescottella subtropica TaxID=2545757 RepID=UPI001F5027B4|nr:NADPH:quinone reductase [Prescottella subtropica]